MFLASLAPYDAATDRVGNRVRLQLGDNDLVTLLKALESSNGGITVDRVVIDSAGVNVRLHMRWDTDICGFISTLDGRPAGVIAYDELAGAVGKPVDAFSKPCLVRLAGVIDVWRRGCLDSDNGKVHVYTKTSDLAFYDVPVGFLQEESAPGVDAIEFSIRRGEPALGPLDLPERQMRLFRSSGLAANEASLASLMSSDDAIESASNLVKQMVQMVGSGKL